MFEQEAAKLAGVGMAAEQRGDPARNVHELPTVVPAAPVADSARDAPAARPADPAPPASGIGPYRLIRVLGEGGFGTVYLAEQKQPQRLVAIKVLRPGIAGPQTLSRFAHEAETLALLQHPGIAQVIEAGFYDPQSGGMVVQVSDRTARSNGALPFFAMEYVEGVTLTEHARDRRLTRPQRLELMIQVCDAVQHAHSKGVIHRDLKPANILVDKSGRARVLDFGVARVTGEHARATMQTDAGQLIGTLGYMSPEQVAADPSGIDTRADVYALGAILYELLSGSPPHQLGGKLLHEATRIICEGSPSRLAALDRTLRGDLDTIVAKALEKERTLRYQTASDLAADLRRFLRDEPIVARPPSTWYQARKFARRNKALVCGIAACFLVLLAGVAATTYWAVQAQRESRRATAVSGFLESTITAVNPDEKGRDVKLASILDESAGQVDRQFGNDPLISATLKASLARAYHSLGLEQEALAQIEPAVSAFEGSLGKEAIETQNARLTRAQVLRSLSRFDEAERIASDVLAQFEKSLGVDHERSRFALDVLAWIAADSGRLETTVARFRDVAERCERAIGPDSGATIRARRLLAEALIESKLEDEGERVLLDVVERLSSAGTDSDVHPDEAVTVRHSLSQLYRLRGDYKRAVEYGREALEWYRKRYGEEHPKSLLRTTSFCRTLIEAGRADEAEGLLRATLGSQQAKLGPDHFDTLTTAAFLADTLSSLGRAEQAYPLRRQVAEARTRTLGPEHAQTMIAWTNLALIALDLGKHDEAETILSDLLVRRERLFGPDHADVAVTLSLLGSSRLKAKQWAGAEQALRRCVEIRSKLFPEGNGVRGYSMTSLGEALLNLGEATEAESLTLTGAEWVFRDPRSPARNKRDAATRAAAVCEALGRPADAGTWRARIENGK